MYNGWLLSDDSRNALMARFEPRFPEVIAHHITLTLNKPVVPASVSARVVGYAVDTDGLEALVVEINGAIERQDGRIYHITWSLDREAGFKPVTSNAVIAEKSYTAIEPIDIDVIPFYRRSDGVDIFE